MDKSIEDDNDDDDLLLLLPVFLELFRKVSGDVVRVDVVDEDVVREKASAHS